MQRQEVYGGGLCPGDATYSWYDDDDDDDNDYNRLLSAISYVLLFIYDLLCMVSSVRAEMHHESPWLYYFMLITMLKIRIYVFKYFIAKKKVKNQWI